MADMKPAPVVVEAKCLTTLGDLDATWEALLRCEAGIVSHDFPAAGRWPVGLVEAVDAPLGSAERIRYIVKQGLSSFKELDLPSNTDLVVATTKGAVDELERGVDPISTRCQPWNIASEIAGFLGISGKISTVSGACSSGTIAIIQACMMISSGKSEVVMAVGIDVISNFVQSGFAALQALSRESCLPFDRKRTGLSTGEGVGGMLVMSEDFAEKRGYDIKARLTGMSVSCDAVHITAPCREGSGLTRVIEKIFLDRPLKRPGAINAHGTGTIYNDAMELTAFSKMWPGMIPPFHSVKGAIGHCLGAAGLIEAAVAVKSLAQGVIPPSTGFEEANDPFAAQINISGSRQLKLENPSILSCNSGFGGINAGILIE